MKSVALSLLIFTLTACVSTSGSTYDNSGLSRDPRFAYAQRLDAQGQLANALIQWQILTLVYPQNTEVREQLSQLSNKIEQQVAKLEQQIHQLLGQPNTASKQHNLQLKILALKPDYQPAIDSLKSNIRHRELAKAKSKNQSEKRNRSNEMSLAKQAQQHQEKLNKLVILAKQQLDAGQFQPLLDTCRDIENLEADFTQLNYYRFNAWTGIGDDYTELKQIPDAVNAYQNATAFANDYQMQNVNTVIASLRQTESERLYTEAMKVFTSDIISAQALLEQAVAIDEHNQRAHQQLHRAQTMSKNLRLIQTNGSTGHN